jgi:putative multiple sugar transport system permease protein
MKTLATLFRSNVRQYGMLIALISIMIFFQYTTEGILMKPINITNLVLQNSYIIVMALGMLLIIVSGAIDLSVGSIAAFIGAIAAVLMVKLDVHWSITMAISLVIGAMAGIFQGYWIAYLKIPSFIVTLAGMLIFRGLTLLILQGEAVGPFPVSFQRLSTGFIPDFFQYEGFHVTTLLLGLLFSIFIVVMDVRSRRNQQKYEFDVIPLYLFVFKNLFITSAVMALSYLMASYKGFPNVLIVLFFLVSGYAYVASQTVIGRRIYAMGGNEKAARLSGVNTPRLLFATFVNMGVLAALAGMIVTARLNTATPKAGEGFELDVIAAVFIGGASATGGIGTIIGAVIGAFLIGVMNNGMSIMGIGIDWQQAIKGFVLLLAVFFDVYNKNKGSTS